MCHSLTWHPSSTDNCQSGLGCWYMVRLSGEIEPNYIASIQLVNYHVLLSILMFLSLTWHLSSTDDCQSGLGCWYMVRLSEEIEPIILLHIRRRPMTY